MTADVAILTKDGVLKGVVEVFHAHATSDASMEQREQCAPCFEVRADDDEIKSQKLIPLCEVSGAKIGLTCVNVSKTKQCTSSCELVLRQPEHQDRKLGRSKRPCFGCKKWGVGYVPIAPYPTSHWKKDFACEKCCKRALNECGKPCSITMGRCGVCESKDWVEKMQRDRERRHHQFASRELEHRRRPCSGCNKWGVGYVPTCPHPTSRWISDFVCNKRCTACEQCGEPCSELLSKCDCCELKATRENDEQERKERAESHRKWVEDRMEIKRLDMEYRRAKERDEFRRVETERLARFDMPPEMPPVPAWAQGRPYACADYDDGSKGPKGSLTGYIPCIKTQEGVQFFVGALVAYTT